MMPDREPETRLATRQRSSLPHVAIALSSVLSCVVVSLTGFMLITLMWRLGVPGPGWATGIGNEESVFSGVAFAGEVAAYSIFLIFITAPLNWGALSFVESNLRAVGHTSLRARIVGASRTCAILFAFLGAIASMPHALHTIAGAVLTAAGLGALSGAAGGALLHVLSLREKPAADPDTFR